jgi:hypothetical protein
MRAAHLNLLGKLTSNLYRFLSVEYWTFLLRIGIFVCLQARSKGMGDPISNERLNLSYNGIGDTLVLLDSTNLYETAR